MLRAAESLGGGFPRNSPTKYGLRWSRHRGYDAAAVGIGLGIFAYNVLRWV